MDLSEKAAVSELFAAQKFERVIHLAAKPGVRYSIQKPDEY